MGSNSKREETNLSCGCSFFVQLTFGPPALLVAVSEDDEAAVVVSPVGGCCCFSFTCISDTFLLSSASCLLLQSLSSALPVASLALLVVSWPADVSSDLVLVVVVVDGVVVVVVGLAAFFFPNFLPLKVDWIFKVAASTALASSSVSIKSTPSEFVLVGKKKVS